METRDTEWQRGYNQQTAWLTGKPGPRRQPHPAASAEHTLSQRAAVEDNPYNQRATQATEDYLTVIRGVLQDIDRGLVSVTCAVHGIRLLRRASLSLSYCPRPDRRPCKRVISDELLAVILTEPGPPRLDGFTIGTSQGKELACREARGL